MSRGTETVVETSPVHLDPILRWYSHSFKLCSLFGAFWCMAGGEYVKRRALTALSTCSLGGPAFLLRLLG